MVSYEGYACIDLVLFDCTVYRTLLVPEICHGWVCRIKLYFGHGPPYPRSTSNFMSDDYSDSCSVFVVRRIDLQDFSNIDHFA